MEHMQCVTKFTQKRTCHDIKNVAHSMQDFC
jgi:hypothetical protein